MRYGIRHSNGESLRCGTETGRALERRFRRPSPETSSGTAAVLPQLPKTARRLNLFSVPVRRLSSFGANAGAARGQTPECLRWRAHSPRSASGVGRVSPIRAFLPAVTGLFYSTGSAEAIRRTLRRSDLRAVFTQEPYNGAPETSGIRRRGLGPHSTLLVLAFSLPGPPERLANAPSTATGTFRYPDGNGLPAKACTAGHVCGALLYSRTLKRIHVQTFR